MTLHRYEEIVCRRNRNAKLDQMLIDYKYAYIMKRGTYYLPGSCGYTSYRSKAGVYKIEEAVQHAKGCEEIYLETIDIEEHNKMVKNEIKNLTERIIQ